VDRSVGVSDRSSRAASASDGEPAQPRRFCGAVGGRVAPSETMPTRRLSPTEDWQLVDLLLF